MANEIRFLHNIVVDINGTVFSTEFIDIEVDIKDTEDEPRNCTVNLYMIDYDKHHSILSGGNSCKIYIQYPLLNKMDLYYSGKILYSYPNQVAEDTVFTLFCDDGYVETLNSYTDVSVTSGVPMLETVNKMLKEANAKLGEYPESLKNNHPSNKSQFIKGDISTQLSRYLGSNYVVTYKDNIISIFERNSSLGHRTIITTEDLFETPRKQVGYESRERKENKTKNNTVLKLQYFIKSIPNPNFSLGKQIKVIGSKYIEEKFYSISQCSFSLNKNEVSCSMELSEIGEEKKE